jgi:hypothetical protein
MSVHSLLSAGTTTIDAYAVTGGRLVASVAALVALAGAVVGGLALARSAGRAARTRAIVAVVAGSIGVFGGGVVVAVADGGPGSGSGVVGGFAALLFGLIATGLGGLVLARSRRTVRPSPGA